MTHLTLQAHPELWPAMDGPMDDDRAWFIAHPSETVRLRPQLPDELETQQALALASGLGSDLVHFTATDGTRNLPTPWMVVVDVLRVHGIPPGPDGNSCRIRLACPEPWDDATAQSIKAMATERALALRRGPQRPPQRRPSGKGFGS